jgi:hypothetical protein
MSFLDEFQCCRKSSFPFTVTVTVGSVTPRSVTPRPPACVGIELRASSTGNFVPILRLVSPAISVTLLLFTAFTSQGRGL